MSNQFFVNLILGIVFFTSNICFLLIRVMVLSELKKERHVITGFYILWFAINALMVFWFPILMVSVVEGNI